MKRTILLVTVLALCAADTGAHEGSRVWIGNVGGKITTFRSDNDLDPTTYWPCRLFMTELELFFDIYSTQFPGYEVRQTGGNVGAGTTFGFNISGPALYFDASSQTFVTVQTMFGPPEPGPVPQMAVSLGSSLRVTGGGPVSGFDFFTFNAPGDHSHLSYTLLGDGTTASDGPSGIYAISLNLGSAVLTTSDTYYLLIGKDVEQSDPVFDLAYSVARQQLIGAGVPGDMDCDGAVGLPDVAEFVEAVLAGSDGATSMECCSLRTADMNQDTRIDGKDIRLFVATVLGTIKGRQKKFVERPSDTFFCNRQQQILLPGPTINGRGGSISTYAARITFFAMKTDRTKVAERLVFRDSVRILVMHTQVFQSENQVKTSETIFTAKSMEKAVRP